MQFGKKRLIKLKILKIVPLAHYQGIVYTYQVDVELENGLKMNLLYTGRKLKDIDIEGWKKARLWVLENPKKTKLSKEKVEKIIPSGKQMSRDSIFIGKIKRFDKVTIVNNRPIIDTLIDVGIGDVYADIDINKFKKDDYVKIEALHVDFEVV